VTLGGRRRVCYTLKVRCAVAVLMLFLMIGSATGVFVEMVEGGDSCEEDCGGEECCPIVCPRCACAARRVAVDMPTVAALPAMEGMQLADLVGDVVAPDSAEADEILHVPIVAG
jgi:hypothetical protein